MAAFGPEQARWFFGRDRLLAELTARLDERARSGGPLMVVAPSGAGKSSLLRAGLLPALEDGALPGSRHWPRLLFTPTAQPMASLTENLEKLPGIEPGQASDAIAAGVQQCARMLHERLPTRDADPDVGGPRMIVVIDQLEELFTQCVDEPERHRFIEVLTQLASPGLGGTSSVALVVCGLRSDFYTHCADYPLLRAALQDGQVFVGPMSQDELREAIQYPAQDVGLDIEPGLVELLLRDLGATTGEAYDVGRLPLLAHALRTTWQQRHGHTLTVESYRVTGGIQQAVATTAERIFTGLSEADRQTARALFLRLVAIGEGTDDVRRRVPRADLLGPGCGTGSVAAVVDAFTQGRLIIQTQDTVEITHEALLSAWPRLRGWVENDREILHARQALADAARRWHQHGRKRGDLLQGTALDTTVTYALAGHEHLTLNLVERAFLDHSIRAARRRSRNRTLLSAVLTVLLVVATGTAVTAIAQGRTLAEKNQKISHQRDEAVGARVAGLATTMRLTDPLTAKRLAVAAVSLAPGSYEAHNALLTLHSQVEQDVYRPFGVDGSWRTDSDATGRLRVYVRGNQVKIADVDARTVIRSFTFPGEPLDDTRILVFPRLSGDGKVLALLRRDRTIVLLDTATGRPRPVTFRSRTVFYNLDAKGERLLLYEPDADTSSVWDTSSGKRLMSIPYSLGSAAITPDEKYLINARKMSLDFWDLRSGRKARTLRVVTGEKHISRIALSPDGKLLALVQGNRLGVVPFTRLATSEVKWWTIRKTVSNPIFENIVFSASSRYVSYDGVIWDTNDLLPAWGGYGSYDDRPVFEYANTDCFDYAFGPGDRTLRCIEDARGASITVISLGAILDPVTFRGGAVLSDGGSTLAVNTLGSFGRVEIWDPTRMVRRNTLHISGRPDGLALYACRLSEDGRLLAVCQGDGKLQIWDVASTTRMTTLSTRHNSNIAFSPDGKTLAVLTKASRSASLLELWDIASGNRRAAVTGQPPQVDPFGIYTESHQILFSRDGRTVISAPDQGVVDTSTGKRLVPPNSGMAVAVALSAKGLLADHHAHDKLTLRDSRSLQQVGRASVGGDPAAFSPDGRLLAVADASDQIRLWDVTANRPLGLPLAGFSKQLWLPGSSLQSLAFAPDGSAILALDSESRLRTHIIAPNKIKTALCAQVGPLSEADWKVHIPEVPYRKTC
ncbi:NACHT and WD repeat domain-containing protein [Nonomuraea sp. NPDC050478]|uniref:NACHT and WD repeat domain-containing protein n=1 Tax=Nonomuraea sp. NPDC050478 TaxID=3364365 RepID=UPI00379B3FC5